MEYTNMQYTYEPLGPLHPALPLTEKALEIHSSPVKSKIIKKSYRHYKIHL